MKKQILVCFCCLLCVSCAARPLAPPTEKPGSVIQFSAWYSLKSIEVPLQGVVHVKHDPVAGKQMERLGLVMSNGSTVGVTVWDAQGKAQRKTGDFPGTYGLLTATEDCLAALLRLRGLAVPGKIPDDIKNDTENDAKNELTGLSDARGPLEMLCKKQGAQMSLRINKEQK